jgi:hypothetical protein
MGNQRASDGIADQDGKSNERVHGGGSNTHLPNIADLRNQCWTHADDIAELKPKKAEYSHRAVFLLARIHITNVKMAAGHDMAMTTLKRPHLSAMGAGSVRPRMLTPLKTNQVDGDVGAHAVGYSFDGQEDEGNKKATEYQEHGQSE